MMEKVKEQVYEIGALNFLAKAIKFKSKLPPHQKSCVVVDAPYQIPKHGRLKNVRARNTGSVGDDFDLRRRLPR
jgi:hypothetical protein